MVAVVSCPVPVLQFFDNTGNPAAGGSILTQVGGVNFITYSDSGGVTALPNPIPLNSRGEVSTAAGVSSQLFLVANVVYTFTLYDAYGNQVWVQRYVNGTVLTSVDSEIIRYDLINSEFVNGVVPTNYWYVPGDPRRYGAKIDGVTNDTVAWQSAINMGSPYFIDIYGTTIVDTLFFPNRRGPTPNFDEGFSFVGPGIGLLIFQAAAPNERVFAKVAIDSQLDSGTFGGFSIKANGSGSTTTAFDCSGFRFCEFNDIAGLSNGPSGFFSLFSVSAYPYLCYKNTWNRPQFNGVTGWTKMFDFNNGGTANAANNSNVGTINDILCYASGGMTVVVDGYRSAKINMQGGLIEANTGSDAIWPGQAWKMTDIWMESNNSPAIVPGAPESGSATVDTLLESCYFSQAQVVNFPSGCTGNIWINPKSVGGVTFTGDTTNHCIVTDITTPAAPTLGVSAGTITFVSATLPVPTNLIQETTYLLLSTYTPVGTGPVAITISNPPTGYSYLNVSASVIRGANGDPKAVGWDSVNLKIWANYTSTDAHNVIVYITLSKPYT